jgi:hypothetical protein
MSDTSDVLRIYFVSIIEIYIASTVITMKN